MSHERVRSLRRAILTCGLLLAAPLRAQSIPAELDGWPVIELTRATRSNGDVWVGTYGHGVLVQPRGGSEWRRIRSDTTKTSLSWDFVHAIAFGPRDQVWVGTIGNGWGLSRDDGRTWRNWTFSELGPEWQYVAPGGILVNGSNVAIATADGIQLTGDDGAHWLALVDTLGPKARGPADSVLAILDDEYIVAMRGTPGVCIQVASLPRSDWRPSWVNIGLRGVPVFMRYDPKQPFAGGAALDLLACQGGEDFGTTERGFRAVIPDIPDSILSTYPEWRAIFGRPIAADNNPYIDQTYRFGSTMGGNFQPHQGVEFNNPDGTPVMAIGAGVVAFSGPAEGGALTVAIRHDSLLSLPDGSRRFVYSVYYHNSALLAAVGDRVGRGDTIARVGNTGRATNDHLHLEVHASPIDSVRLVVDPAVRYPPYVTNPELWIEPLQGTGLIAGRVFDAAGNAVPQARIYGIVKPEPRETPFAFAETYGPRNAPSPMYGEHFAISDVPAGTHTLRARIGDRWIERRVTVAPGVMTWVEFRP